jgi:hypothetical protein
MELSFSGSRFHQPRGMISDPNIIHEAFAAASIAVQIATQAESRSAFISARGFSGGKAAWWSFNGVFFQLQSRTSTHRI